MPAEDLRLDSPPMQPPAVSSQMGAGSEMLGISNMIREKGEKEGGPKDFSSMAQTHPQGALITRVEAVQKVLSETARMDPVMAKYCERATEILRTGLAEALKAQKPGVVPNQEQSNRPPSGEAMRSFVG